MPSPGHLASAFALLTLSLSLTGPVSAAEPYEAFLQKHCARCHGPEKEKGDLRFDKHTVALTRGSAGSLVWHKGQYDEKTAPKVAVVDTVGAGDSFTAALAIGLLRGEDLSRIHQRAVDVAAFVCTKAGATPELLPEFKR